MFVQILKGIGTNMIRIVCVGTNIERCWYKYDENCMRWYKCKSI